MAVLVILEFEVGLGDSVKPDEIEVFPLNDFTLICLNPLNNFFV